MASVILFIISRFFERIKSIVNQINIKTSGLVKEEHKSDFEMIAAWLNERKENVEQELISAFKSILKEKD